jgi:hypothetical protein
MRSKHGNLSPWAGSALFWLAVAASVGSIGCTEPEVETFEFEPFAEAELRFAQPDSSPLRSFSPNDLKAESPDAAWIADPGIGAVFRFEPPRDDYRQMGFRDEPPGEVDRPAKLAVEKTLGLFTFDLGSGQVHQFTPDGEPIRAFETGFVPARFEIARSPIGLVFGRIDNRDPQQPRLIVVRTDTRGASPDTLLQPDSHGPPSLWMAIASSGELSLDGSESGLWAWAEAVPDTVFDITDRPDARKRVLRPQDRDSMGILADLDRHILWVVRAGGTPGELRFAAYDTREPGTVGPDRAFLGERVTYSDFVPWDAIDGTIMGFRRPTPGRFMLVSYDMRVPPTLP